MPAAIRIGDHVKVFLDSKFWKSEGWFEESVVRTDLYSKHRKFYWVELDVEVEARHGNTPRMVSVFSPKNIQTQQ